ncbi:exonuclease [Pseudoduganella lutea]|uniref:Exonuclease n=1 Tax=Pseudoduganella lutea TaxID=321985 RepID=A0A4P6L5P4_9BURK|nr:exonuclease [Pseudoduganella lutea]QBE66847.1 exonuclease [Pseudoduganella lutea]
MRIALIDADVNAFQAAAVNEKSIDWGDGVHTLHAHEEDVIKSFQASINSIQAATGADKVILAFSDDDRSANWRLKVLPSYKATRAGQRSPMLRKFITAWARENYETFTRPTLEGDDVLGILATRSNPAGDEYIICTIDKDMKTVPGHHYNFGKKELFEVTEEEADRWHLVQTLVGDSTDNYAGCPGMGYDTAEEFLNDPYIWTQYEHTFKSGPRKGTTELRWTKEPLGNLPIWEGVVSCFNKVGLGEEEALVQARVARICRASDYDFKTKKVKLWNPSSK